MTDTSDQTSQRALRIPIETITRYAGATALVTAVLVLAGIVSTGAYLSAWSVPVWLVRLDPLTAALRSETVLLVAAATGLVLIGLLTLRARLRRRRWEGFIVNIATLVVTLLAVLATLAGQPGIGLALVGGVVLFLARDRLRASDAWLALGFAVLTILAANAVGRSAGMLVRDDPAWQTSVSLSTEAPVADLPGGGALDGVWRYEDLYLVFRDGESLFVSVPGAGPRAWVIPGSNVTGLSIGD